MRGMIELPIGRNIIAFLQNLLTVFGKQKIVEKDRRMRVRGFTRESDAIGPDVGRLNRIPVDRGAALLQLLGLGSLV